MEQNKAKILIVLACLLFFGFSLTSLTSYYSAHDTLSEQVSQTALPLTSDNVYSEIQRDLLLPIQVASSMANNSFLHNWVSNGETNPDAITAYLSQIQSKHNAITSFFVSERTRKYYHSSGILKIIDTQDRQDDWYINFLNSGREYELNPDTDTSQAGRIVVFINYRMHDKNGVFLGVTGVGLALHQVQQQIESYQRRYGGQITLIDATGRITLSTRTGYINKKLSEIADYQQEFDAILANEDHRFKLSSGDKERYLLTRQLSDLGWILMVEQDSHSQDTKIFYSLLSNLAVSLGICSLVLLAAYMTIQRFQSRLEEMATTDKLTGASNRHIFEPVFDQVTKNASRNRNPVSIALIDIDHFKQINDTHGHHAGDMALLLVVDVIKERLRESDVVCRWGGEEFLIVLPNCNAEMAAHLCETIRQELEDQPLHYNEHQINLTVSIGLSQYQPHETATKLLKRVDGALYYSKEIGRNRTTCQ